MRLETRGLEVIHYSNILCLLMQGTKVSLENVFSADDVDKLLKLSESSDKTHHVDLKVST